MSSSSDDEDEYTSLADKLKDKYVSSIEATLKTIERVQLVSSQLIDTQHQSSNATTTTRKRKADRRLASWIDARIEPQRTNSTGPGCSICISTFEELQSEGKQLKTTPCGHVFCADCLEISTQHAKKCPKCRKAIRLNKCHPIYPDLLE